MKTKSIQKPSSQQSFNRTRPTASPAAATTRRAVQVTFGSATLKGSNVIAPGKEVRRNPGFEGLSFVQRWLENGIWNGKGIASKMKTKPNFKMVSEDTENCRGYFVLDTFEDQKYPKVFARVYASNRFLFLE
ncbi:hypothetical protein JYB64_08435 [Algoriphagus aestuarii]|nr:hypothetical protein [Algoriphagus aestuarii]